jgi:hypothetical protein
LLSSSPRTRLNTTVSTVVLYQVTELRYMYTNVRVSIVVCHNRYIKVGFVTAAFHQDTTPVTDV